MLYFFTILYISLAKKRKLSMAGLSITKLGISGLGMAALDMTGLDIVEPIMTGAWQG